MSRIDLPGNLQFVLIYDRWLPRNALFAELALGEVVFGFAFVIAFVAKVSSRSSFLPRLPVANKFLVA